MVRCFGEGLGSRREIALVEGGCVGGELANDRIVRCMRERLLRGMGGVKGAHRRSDRTMAPPAALAQANAGAGMPRSAGVLAATAMSGSAGAGARAATTMSP